jgi:hypothetical protein
LTGVGALPNFGLFAIPLLNPVQGVSMSLQPEAAPAAPPSRPPLSLLGRFAAVFVRPAEAWGGLEEHQQWWFPVLLVALMNVVIMLPLYERAYLPTYYDQLDSQVASGALEPGQAERMQQFMESRVMGPIVAGIAGLASVVMTLGTALIVWFGVGFILGAKFRYRMALEVTAWSGLVLLPQHVAFFALAWSQETMKGIHFGLAAFLPEADPPARWHAMLAVALDAFGPFNVWYVAVAVLGCAALTGGRRRDVAWVLGGLAVALAVVSALLSGWLAPPS